MPDTHIETTDIYQGAFLLCKGGDLSEIRVKGNGRPMATFLITGNRLETHARQYRSGQALVNPIELRESLNHLRDRLFEILRGHERRDGYDRTRQYRGHKGRN